MQTSEESTDSNLIPKPTTPIPSTPTHNRHQTLPTTPQSQYIWRCKCCNSTHPHTPSSGSKNRTPGGGRKTPKTPSRFANHLNSTGGIDSPSRQLRQLQRKTPGKLKVVRSLETDSLVPPKPLTFDREARDIVKAASPPRRLVASDQDREEEFVRPVLGLAQQEQELVGEVKVEEETVTENRKVEIEKIEEKENSSETRPAEKIVQEIVTDNKIDIPIEPIKTNTPLPEPIHKDLISSNTTPQQLQPTMEMQIDSPPPPAGPSTSTVPSPPTPSASPSNLSPEIIAALLASDPEDEISQTLPIYLTSSQTPHIQLFQFPLSHQPVRLPPHAASQGERITARMKEAVDRFELEIPVDTREEVWDEEKAGEMGFREEDERRVKGKREREAWGLKMRLRSEEVPWITGYWMGMIQENALHIHPVSKLFQLRPSLAYLDEIDNKKKNDEARKKKGDDDDDDDMDDDEDANAAAGGSKTKDKKPTQGELKSVSVQLLNSGESILEKTQTRRTTKMGTNGTIGLTSQIRTRIVTGLKKEAEDDWVRWNWVDNDMDHISELLDKLVVPPEERGVLQCTTQPLDLISNSNIGDGAVLPH